MKELSYVTGFYDTFEGEELRSRENGATLKIERPQRKHFSLRFRQGIEEWTKFAYARD